MDEKVWIKQDSSNALPDSTTPFSTSTSWDKVTTFHNQIGQDQWLLPQSDEPKEKISEDNPSHDFIYILLFNVHSFIFFGKNPRILIIYFLFNGVS
jgi:hypothetical protein